MARIPVLCAILFVASRVLGTGAVITSEDMVVYRERARHMFQHAYDSYMSHGFPYDEVKPLSCKGFNTWGNFSLTLVDSLDTLIIMGNVSEFENAYDKVLDALNFDVDFVTSVFESNIRVLGGLLSAHLLLHRTTVKLDPGWPCSGRLLDLAVDLADRLLPAFDTPTKMPYGSINLRHGVPDGETTVTCAAGVGTFVMEFGVLSRLTGDMRYENAALAAMQALHDAREQTGLVQSHVDVSTGKFTVRESSIGSGMDSYFEYMLKGGILLHNRNLLDMFNSHYHAIRQYLRRDDWYIVADADTGNGLVAVYQSLESFFPGLQTLMGDVRPASRTASQYSTVWRRFGAVPEMYDLHRAQPRDSHSQYPLRPELMESVMYLSRATGDPFWLEMGRAMLESIDRVAKCPCGYGTILNVSSHELEDRMHSYFLSETVKYLYLLFDEDNFIFNDLNTEDPRRAPDWTQLSPGCQIGTGGYVFSTEAHPFNIGTMGCCHRAEVWTPTSSHSSSENVSDDDEEEEDEEDEEVVATSLGSDWPYGAAQLDKDGVQKLLEPRQPVAVELAMSSADVVATVAQGRPMLQGDVDDAVKMLYAQAGRPAAALDLSNVVVVDMDAKNRAQIISAMGVENRAEIISATDMENAESAKLLLSAMGDENAAVVEHVLRGLAESDGNEQLLQTLLQQLQTAGLSNEQLAAVMQSLASTGQHSVLTGVSTGADQDLPPTQAHRSHGDGDGGDRVMHHLRTISEEIAKLDGPAASTEDDVTRHTSAVREAELFLGNLANADDVVAEYAEATRETDDVVADFMNDAVDTLGTAESVVAQCPSMSPSTSKRYLDKQSRFAEHFYLSPAYTSATKGLRSRLELFGGTVDLK